MEQSEGKKSSLQALKNSLKDITRKVGKWALQVSNSILRYPSWFKQRRKATQFALLYSGIGIVPFILYPFCSLVLKINANGFSIKSTPLAFTLSIGYAGAIAAGFIGGNTLLAIYTVIGIFAYPLLYVRKGKGPLGIGLVVSILMLFGIAVGDVLGIRYAPFGISTRSKAQNLMTRTVEPSSGAEYSSEVELFLAKNTNWISMKQGNELRSIASFKNLQYKAYKKQEEEKRIAREAQEAEERKVQQIADGTYMPDEFEVGRPCKELAEENSLTKSVDWGWFGAANSKWFPQQKTIILEGKTKNAFGVEIPFNIECRWEKGGIVRIVEIGR